MDEKNICDLKPDKYDRLEQSASRYLPNRILEAYRPIHFYKTGYPTHVDSIGELWKYADAMHSGGFDNLYNNIIKDISLNEFELFKWLCKNVLELSRRYFDREILPCTSILRAIYQYRHINKFCNKNKLNIFEIGPGSGYLGAILTKNKYQYASMDNTQAFCLFEKILWNFLKLNINQLFWWEYACNNNDFFSDVELVTANHVICEMHINAFKHMLHLFKNADTYIIDGFGCSKIHERKERIKIFSRHGYTLQYSGEKVKIFSKSKVT